MKEFKTEKCSLLPMGSGLEGDDLHFSINTREKIDKIVLFKRGTKQKAGEAQVSEDRHFGNLYALKVKNAAKYDYAIMAGDHYVRDEYAKAVNRYTDEKGMVFETYSPYIDDFDWEDDERVFYPFEDSVIYRLHVKGFTRHASSGVEHRGCFAGVAEKIPYLKELGITSIELMPAYEYEDCIQDGSAKGKKNYWGYGAACYFAPKVSYGTKGSGSRINEFKQMVKELHKNQIEVIMEFHFAEGTSPHTIMDALRFWVVEYHIDGIHVNFNVAPLNMIKSDPLISMVKLIGNYDISEGNKNYGEYKGYKRIGVYNGGFLANERRFIKSDDGQVYGMMEQVRSNPEFYAGINYLSNHDSMSLMDSVSYDRKHNESNGENNGDGTDYNFSWNCGVEGATRRKKVKAARIRQMKNGITLLMLSQGTPMIFAGDEMGKSRKGNNNPYCQDNELNWLDWRDLERNAGLFQYMKEMIAFRKKHRILHTGREPRQMDTISCGFPDLSYHGSEPWRVDTSYNSRCFAFLYSGKYDRPESEDIYVACNMHWDERHFALPIMDRNRAWQPVFVTDDSVGEQEAGKLLTVSPRTILVLICKPIPKKLRKKAGDREMQMTERARRKK